MEEAPTRFQRGVDPGDEGREVRHQDLTIDLKAKTYEIVSVAKMGDPWTPGGYEDDI